MKGKTFLWILLGLIIIFAGIQFIPVDRSAEEVDQMVEFATIEQPPSELATLLKDACYDCHSYETTYPWYAKVAPVSWMIQDHVTHGRGNLNFSIWGTYPKDKQAHKMEEVAEEVAEGEMPLKGYVAMHAEAQLTAQQKEMLENWFMKRAKTPVQQPMPSINTTKKKELRLKRDENPTE